MNTVEQLPPLDSSVQERLSTLEKGFAGWAEQIEKDISKRRVPELSEKEGEEIALKFEKAGINLRELIPAVPEKTTEGPIMEAIETDLRKVFGEDIVETINNFVLTELIPLRGGGGPNEFLAMATENLIRDIIAVARAFQLDSGLKQAALSNLEDSVLVRVRKGQKRAEGFCAKEAHQEHIWHVRGVRDVPPGGFAAIGGFIDQLLSKPRQA